ncbi:MAG TPA: type II toxin-antitoxin system HicA family toxin [Rhodospirillales bacterium]|nr:type II toxin-antitoxin system HicA family toxin [Rhodospirillales bacterium]
MSRRLPALSSRKVVQALERAGFRLHRARGSHHFFIRPGRPDLLVVVPHHGGDLRIGTLRSIIKQAGLSEEEFLALL